MLWLLRWGGEGMEFILPSFYFWTGLIFSKTKLMFLRNSAEVLKYGFPQLIWGTY